MSKWTIYDKHGVQKLQAVELEFHDAWMGEEFVTVNITSPTPINLEIGDYLMYRGLTYTIYSLPTALKKARSGSYGDAFRCDGVKLSARSTELTEIRFFDIVLNDNNLHYTSMPTFSFYAETVDDLLDRIQANTDRNSQTPWLIISYNYTRTINRYPSGSAARTAAIAVWKSIFGDTPSDNPTNAVRDNEKKDVNISIDRQSVFDSLQHIKNSFGLNFITRERILIVGGEGIAAEHIFRYGKGNGLYEIERTADADQQVVTKLFAYGSDKNLPTRYYADLGKSCYAIAKDEFHYGNIDYLQVRLYVDELDTKLFTTPSSYSSSSSNPRYIVTLGLKPDEGSSEMVTVKGSYYKSTEESRPMFQMYCDRRDPYGSDTWEPEYGKAYAFSQLAQRTSVPYRVYILDGINKELWPASIVDYSTSYLPNNMAVNVLMLPGFPAYSLYELCRYRIVTENGVKKTCYDIRKTPTSPYNTILEIEGEYPVSFSTDRLNPYVLSQNVLNLGVKEGDIHFTEENDDNGLEEVYPSVEGMTENDVFNNGSNARLDEVVSCEIITDDGKYRTDDPEYKFPNFHLVIPNLGFNLKETAEESGGDVTISFTDGYCGGRDFKVHDITENLNGTWDLELERCPDDTLSLMFPYSDAAAHGDTPIANEPYQIRTGDHYVLTGINITETSYIWGASIHALVKALKWLLNNDYTRFTYLPKVDEIYMARQNDLAVASQGTIKSLHDTLKAGMMMAFDDDDLGVDGNVFIDSLTIKENGNNGIPTYEVVLRNDKQVGTLQRVQNQINSLTSFVNGGGGGLTISQIKSLITTYGGEKFLSKLTDDTAHGFISLIKGLQVSGQFVSGLLGEGGVFRKEADGKTYIEVDKMYVRMKAYFDNVEIKDYEHTSGNRIASKAGLKCTHVEWIDSNGEVTDVLADVVKFRCYFRAKDGEDTIDNDFIVGDLAFCDKTTFDNGTISHHRYWRAVVAKNGTLSDDDEFGYIDLSKTDCESGSDVPVAGDDISQLGNKTDTERQGAIIEYVGGADAPSYQIYQGINSYSLNGKSYIDIGYNSQTGRAKMNVYGDAYIGDRNGTTFVKYEQENSVTHAPKLTIKAVIDVQSTIGNDSLPTYIQNNQIKYDTDIAALVSKTEDLQEQIDGAIETYYMNGQPSLSLPPVVSTQAHPYDDPWLDGTETQEERTRILNNHVGDLYYDKATGHGYRFLYDDDDSTFKWTVLTDEDVTEALRKADAAQTTADGKSTIFLNNPNDSDTTKRYPKNYKAGDSWILPVDATINSVAYKSGDILTTNTDSATYSAAHWSKRVRYTDDTTVTNFINNSYSPFAASIQGQVDKKAETWYQASDPSTDWNTNNKKIQHVGDIWCDTSANGGKKTYIWVDNGTSANPRFEWKPQDVPDEVFDKIDGKADIFVSKPTAYNRDDMWIIESGIAAADTPTGCQAGDIVIADNLPSGTDKRTAFVVGDWRKKDRYTDDTKYNGFITALLNGMPSGSTEVTVEAALNAIKAALNQGTTVSGGLVLSTLIGLRDSNSVLWAGINGQPNNNFLGKGIAGWYGGAMADMGNMTEAQRTAWDAKTEEQKLADSSWAKTLFRFDGSGYLAANNIYWNAAGSIVIKNLQTIYGTAGDSISINTLSGLSAIFATETYAGVGTTELLVNPQNAFSHLFINRTGSVVTYPSNLKTINDYAVLNFGEMKERFVSLDFFNALFTAYSDINHNNVINPVTWTNTEAASRATINNLRIMVGAWTQQYLSALGHNSSGGSGGGGVDMTEVWDALANPTSQQINVSHLGTALSSYALKSEAVTSIDLVNGTYYATRANGTTFTFAVGGVTEIILGSVPYSVVNGTITLPAYPTDYWKTGDSRTANTVLAAPNGSNGVATFRALVAADIPNLGSVYLPLSGGTMSNTNLVTNLNADLLDGHHSSEFLFLTGGTLTGNLNIGLGTGTEDLYLNVRRAIDRDVRYSLEVHSDSIKFNHTYFDWDEEEYITDTETLKANSNRRLIYNNNVLAYQSEIPSLSGYATQTWVNNNVVTLAAGGTLASGQSIFLTGDGSVFFDTDSSISYDANRNGLSILGCDSIRFDIFDSNNTQYFADVLTVNQSGVFVSGNAVATQQWVTSQNYFKRIDAVTLPALVSADTKAIYVIPSENPVTGNLKEEWCVVEVLRVSIGNEYVDVMDKGSALGWFPADYDTNKNMAKRGDVLLHSSTSGLSDDAIDVCEVPYDGTTDAEWGGYSVDYGTAYTISNTKYVFVPTGWKAISTLTTITERRWEKVGGGASGIGTVNQIKVGNTVYNPTMGIVSLPAYPTTLPASDVYAWAKAANKPTYTLDEVSDGTTRKLANYLPLTGGTLTGTLTLSSTVTNFTGSGSGTYNRFSLYVNSNGVTFETPRASDSATANPLGFYVRTRGGEYDYITAKGFKKDGSSSSYVLTGDGGHAAISGLSVGHASTAGTATSASTAQTANCLAGGAAGSIPYQTAAGTTAFLAASANNGYVLAYNTSTNAPYWKEDNNSNSARLQVSDTTNKRINTMESTSNYIQFTGGTNKFTVSDGTNSFDIAITPSVTFPVTSVCGYSGDVLVTQIGGALTNAGYKLTDTIYTLPAATANALGGIKVGYTTANKKYKVQLDSNNNAYVDVPWTDTTYDLSGYATQTWVTNNFLALTGGTISGEVYMIGDFGVNFNSGSASIYYEGSVQSDSGLLINSVDSVRFNIGSSGSIVEPLVVSASGVAVTGSLTVGGTAVSLVGHTHDYLPLTGGTMTGPISFNVATHFHSLRIYEGNSAKSYLGYYPQGDYAYWSNETNYYELRIYDNGDLKYAKYNSSNAVYTIYHSNNLKNVSQLTNDAGYITNAALSNYLPLGGGTMTGTIYRAYTASNQTPLIWMNGDNYDNYLWQISAGTSSKQAYGFALKYLGTGSDNNNKLVLYADNQMGTDVAAYSITQDGVITFGATPNVNGTNVSLSTHTHTTTIASDTGNNQLTLAYGGKYKLTAGGTSFIFTMPSADDTNTWRGIYTGGTSRVGNGTNTKAMNISAYTGIGIEYYAAGTAQGQSGNADYFTIAIRLDAAATSSLGGVKIGYSESDKNYAVKLDGSNKAYVTVPWTDNNTTYTIATGDSNGQIKVTPSSGSAYNVSVKGLGSLAYKSSLSASDIPDLSSTYLPLTGGTLSGNIEFPNDTGVVFDTDSSISSYYTQGGSNNGLHITGSDAIRMNVYDGSTLNQNVLVASVGGVNIAGVLTLGAADGTAPIVTSSTTVVTNLNADRLDGYHAANFIKRYAWWGETASHSVDDVIGGTTFAYTTHSAPTSGTIVDFSCSTNDNYRLQLQGSYGSDNLYFRSRNGDNNTWRTWRYVIHSGNISSQSVAYATTAGSATDSTKVAKTGDSMTGRLTISSTENWSNAPLIVNNNQNAAWLTTGDFFAPNIGTSKYNAIIVGKEAATNNAAHLSFYYAGAGSTSNRVALAFVNNTDLLVVRADGDVGIGTTAPTCKLDVKGIFRNIYTENPYAGSVTAKFLCYETSPYGILFRGYSNGTHSIQVQREANGNETYNLSLNPLGGNVAIGKVDASYKLDVSGTVGASSFVKSGSDDTYVLLGGGGHSQLKTINGQSIFGSGNVTFTNGSYDAQVEYLQATGTQYFDTGWVPNYGDGFVVEAEYMFSSSGSRGCLISNVAVDRALSLELVSGPRYYFNSGQLDDTYTVSAGVKHTTTFSYVNNTYTMIVDGVTRSTRSYTLSVSSAASMFMFLDRALRTTTFNKETKIYRLSITSGGTLVRDFIPVRIGSVGYMYDKVQKKLYGNVGSGSFTFGNDVAVSYLPISGGNITGNLSVGSTTQRSKFDVYGGVSTFGGNNVQYPIQITRAYNDTLNFCIGSAATSGMDACTMRIYNNTSGGGDDVYIDLLYGGGGVNVYPSLSVNGNAVIHAGNISTQSVNYATSAGTAAGAGNLAGGAQGSIPYQSAAGTTAFLAGGTDGYVLAYDATNKVPYWKADSNTTYNFSGTTFVSGNQSTAEHNASNAISNGHYYYNISGPSTSTGATTGDGALFVQSYNSGWIGQIAQDYRNGNLFVRGKNNGSWMPWKAIATADSDFVLSADKIFYNPNGRKFTKVAGGSSAWDTQVYSRSGYKECRVTCKVEQTSKLIMVGLNSDPTTNAGYDTIDYCWYFNNSSLFIYENGTSITPPTGHTSYAAGDEFIVEYSSGYVRYYHNGVLCRSVARAYGTPLYMDSSFYNYGSIYDVVFEPIHTEDTTKLPLSGGTLSGELYFVGDFAVNFGDGNASIYYNGSLQSNSGLMVSSLNAMYFSINDGSSNHDIVTINSDGIKAKQYFYETVEEGSDVIYGDYIAYFTQDEDGNRYLVEGHAAFEDPTVWQYYSSSGTYNVALAMVSGTSDTCDNINHSNKLQLNTATGALSVSGTLSVAKTAASNSEAILTVTNNYSSSYARAIDILIPNVSTKGYSSPFLFGKAHGTNDQGSISFGFVSSGSISNYIGFGFFNNDNKLIIKATGDVGIGTTSPAFKLEVNGSFNATTGYIGGYTIITSNTIGSQSVASATNISGGAQGSIPYQTAAGTTAFLAATANNGYVLAYNTTTHAPYWKADNNDNTWRNVYTGGTSRIGSGTTTKAINFASGNSNIFVEYKAAGTGTGQSGSADYFTVQYRLGSTLTGIDYVGNSDIRMEFESVGDGDAYALWAVRDMHTGDLILEYNNEYGDNLMSIWSHVDIRGGNYLSMFNSDNLTFLQISPSYRTESGDTITDAYIGNHEGNIILDTDIVQVTNTLKATELLSEGLQMTSAGGWSALWIGMTNNGQQDWEKPYLLAGYDYGWEIFGAIDSSHTPCGLVIQDFVEIDGYTYIHGVDYNTLESVYDTTNNLQHLNLAADEITLNYYGTNNTLVPYLTASYSNSQASVYINANVGIGTAVSSTYKLKVEGKVYLASGNTAIYQTNPASNVAFWTINGTGTQAIVSNGAMSATQFNNNSDARKKNVIDNRALVAVDTIAMAPAVRFKWKDSDDTSLHCGSLAQYWNTVMPECVQTDYQGYLSMQYDVIALLASISIAKEVVDHERRITELERENERLRTEIEQLRLSMEA